MNELRKDYILDRWVVIAPGRSKRPEKNKRQEDTKPKDTGVCFFCPGNENLTPPEITRIEENGKWIIRCFPNKFPVTSLDAPLDSLKKDVNPDENLMGYPAYGKHEIIVETGDHEKDLSDLSVEHLVKVFDMYSQRMAELLKIPGVEYVLIFKNRGVEGGASLSHTHTQVVGLSIMPKLIQEEVNASKKHKDCPFCGVWKSEIKTERRVYEDQCTVSFTPYASRFPYELWIMPKRHVKSITDLTPKEKISLASVLKNTIAKLNDGFNNLSYNFYLHVSPEKDDLHFHIELFPRTSRWAGFEFGSDIPINTVSPEEAAKYYRE